MPKRNKMTPMLLMDYLGVTYDGHNITIFRKNIYMVVTLCVLFVYINENIKINDNTRRTNPHIEK